MQYKLISAMAAVALMLSACGPSEKAEKVEKAAEPAAAQQASAQPAPAAALQPSAQPASAAVNPRDLPMPSAGEGTGVLSTVEDAGYPMFWVVITPTSGTPVAALVNNEELKTPEGISALKGKTVKATIEIREEGDLLLLTADGKNVFENKPESGGGVLGVSPTAKMITGKLSGATPSGDLPTEMAVTAKDGTKAEMRAFIDDNVVKLNGKEVTAVYDVSKSAYVTKMEPVETK